MNARIFLINCLFCLPLRAICGEVPGTVTGFATLPPNLTFPAPQEAPEFAVAGKYTGEPGTATALLQSLPGKSKGRPTGFALPVSGQPRQGYSDLQMLANGQTWAITDNGFGARGNSKDALLVLTRFWLNWTKHEAKSQKDVLLHDPKHLLPFPIANAVNNPKRYLSGADLDPESFRMAGSGIWIGDEFGPYLVKTTASGELRAVLDAEFGGGKICSPDHPTFAECKFQIKRSKGFENLAALPGKQTLLAMLEGSLPNEAGTLKALEFDLRRERWTGRAFDYALETPSNSVGAIAAWSANHLLVLERDDLEGVDGIPCRSATSNDCFNEPAKFKRLYIVRIDRKSNRLVKGNYIDLLKLRDPEKHSGSETYSMPFWTIEAVAPSGSQEVIIANDNNFPSSASRHPNQQDANEFVQVNIRELLKGL